MGNYLVDSICPKWLAFVKKILAPLEQKRKLFAKAQKAHGKDVEHAFGVFQAWFAIVRGPTRFFYHETLQDIMKACIILHNMIIDDEPNEVEAIEVDYEKLGELKFWPDYI